MTWRIDQIALTRPDNLSFTGKIQKRENKPLDKLK